MYINIFIFTARRSIFFLCLQWTLARTRSSETMKIAFSSYLIRNRVRSSTRRYSRLWTVPTLSRTRNESTDSPNVCSCPKARRKACPSSFSCTWIQSKKNFPTRLVSSATLHSTTNRPDSHWTSLPSTSATTVQTWCWKMFWSITKTRQTWMSLIKILLLALLKFPIIRFNVTIHPRLDVSD